MCVLFAKKKKSILHSPTMKVYYVFAALVHCDISSREKVE